MKRTFVLALAGMLGFCGIAVGQQPGQPQFKIDSTNRSLSVSASETVTVEPEVAILHIGFSTQPNDPKAAYAEGARTSNTIISAVKQDRPRQTTSTVSFLQYRLRPAILR